MKVYLNSKLIEKEDSSEIFEPGFLFGWGVFEPLRVYQGKVCFLKQHIERLESSLKLLDIEPVNLDWQKEINKLLKENNLSEAYLRITVYKKRKGTGVIIYTDKFSYYTPQTYEKGFNSIVASQRRFKSICSKIKSLSYLENRSSWFQAQKAKKDEALVLNEQNILVGGSRSNLFLVKNKEIFTPSLESGAFCGVTRTAVIVLAKNLGFVVKEDNLSLDSLYSADEAFITSSLMEVMPLFECEDKKIGTGKPGEITLKLLTEYRKLLNN